MPKIEELGTGELLEAVFDLIENADHCNTWDQCTPCYCAAHAVKILEILQRHPRYRERATVCLKSIAGYVTLPAAIKGSDGEKGDETI